MQAVFSFLRLVCVWPENEWPATVGQAGGCRVPGIRRGQRCVRSVQSPADGRSKPWEVVPVGIASLVCPAGHGDEVGGRKALEGMKKQGAGASRCNFLTPQKLDCTPKIFGFVVFVVKKVFSAPLVRMRSPVQIWIAAPRNS